MLLKTGRQKKERKGKEKRSDLPLASHWLFPHLRAHPYSTIEPSLNRFGVPQHLGSTEQTSSQWYTQTSE